MFGYDICSLHLTHPTTGAVGCYDQRPGSKLGFRGQCLAQGHFDKQTVFGSGGIKGIKPPTLQLVDDPLCPPEVHSKMTAH